jgi:hypothetical protein
MLDQIAENIKKNKNNITKTVAEEAGVSPKQVEKAMPTIASAARGAAVAQQSGVDTSKANVTDLAMMDPTGAPKDVNKDSSTKQLIAQAISAFVPIIAGGLLGGARGASIGGQVGAQTSQNIGAGYEAQKEKEIAQKRFGEESALKQRAMSVQEREAAVKEEANLIRGRELDIQNKQRLAAEKAVGSKKEFESLPKENQEGIISLGKKNADLFNAGTQLSSLVKVLKDPKVSPQQKLIQANQSLKLLNSLQGSDAVGAEEAKRIGSLLAYWPNTTKGLKVGPDLEAFTNQIMLTENTVNNLLSNNQQTIAMLHSGSPIPVRTPNVVADVPGASGGVQSAYAGDRPNFSKMSDEDLKTYLRGSK